MSTLRYHAGAEIEDLAVGECVARPATHEGVRYWNLWFRYAEPSDSDSSIGRVPFITDDVPKTGPESPWLLERVSSDTWQVWPSIRISDGAGRECWHQTPALVGVPEPPPWSAP